MKPFAFAWVYIRKFVFDLFVNAPSDYGENTYFRIYLPTQCWGFHIDELCSCTYGMVPEASNQAGMERLKQI